MKKNKKYDVKYINFRPDFENWGLGTFLYAYLLYWLIVVLLIKIIL